MFENAPERPNRRTLRLPHYDYNRSGAYFITICTQGRLDLFETIIDGRNVLNVAGEMILKWWNTLDSRYGVLVDEYIVMPNHLHGIVIVQETRSDAGAHIGAPLQQIVRWFKTMTTNEYIRGVHRNGWQPFTGRLWQRNYYEHIIRDDEDLFNTRKYIRDNPRKWDLDKENPHS